MPRLTEDYRRFRCEIPGSNLVNVALYQQGFWAIAEYRMTHYLGKALKPRLLRAVVLKLLGPVHKIVEILTGILLPYTAEIGRGLFIPHFGPIMLNMNSRVGDHCTIHPGVTLGAAGRGAKRGAPRLGNRVYVGTQAIILGNIEIGDDAAIGAGAVVTRPVAARAVVVGNPARVISHAGSFDLISYPGMNSDAERLASLRLAEAGGKPKENGATVAQDELDENALNRDEH